MLTGGDTSRVRTRLEAAQPLWVLAGRDGTLLCARHALAGPVLLSWTTREELECGVNALFDPAPVLFETHDPQQRPLASLLGTARGMGLRLRIDDYVVEDLERAR